MTEAVLDLPSISTELPLSDAVTRAAPLAKSPGTSASRLHECIRAGKLSPAVAAQWTRVLNSDSAQSSSLSPTAPPDEFHVLEMAGNMATGCTLAILVMGAIGLGISMSTFTESYLLVVAGLIFAFVTLGVVVTGSLNQAPSKPRPAKPQKAVKPKPAEGKAAEPKPAQPDSPAPAAP